MTTTHRSALAALALSALCVLGIIVLTALHQAPPAVLSQLALGAAFAGAGIASPLAGVRQLVDQVSTPAQHVPTPPVAPADPPPAYTAAVGG